MTLKNLRPLVVALGTLAIVAACGGGGGGGGGTTAKETLTIGGFNFSESSILADMYGQALKAKGYTIAYKLNLGSREVVAPALKTGQVDLYPGYAATELEFFNNKKGEAGGDPQANVTKLNTYLSAFGAEALTPSPASDENAFAVTKALATKDNLVKISDLKPVASQLVLGGPPECPTRPYCELGLKSVYGLTFKDFKSLDAGGSLTKGALEKGDIDVGLVAWRRRVGDLYRLRGPGALEEFRRGRDRLFREHPQSPTPQDERETFGGLRYFSPDPAYRLRCRLEPSDGSQLVVDTGGDDGVIRYRRAGQLRFQVQGRDCRLTVFSIAAYAGGLFLPFADTTSGQETYGAGRYLFDTVKNTDGLALELEAGSNEVTIDFNYAYNPSCAYSPLWACPLAPPENRLPVAVRAGELTYPT